MTVLITTTHTALPADGSAPEWVHLLPAGSFTGSDGRGPYQADLAAVIAATAPPLVLDENHATDRALVTGQAAPARGWMTEMQARDDGIWARVEWTPAGTALMAERSYRGISPVFQHTKDGRVTRLLRAALTNAPNLTLTALHSQDASMDLLTQLRQALGLPETVDQAAVLAAVTAQRTAVAAHAQQISAVAVAAGLAKDAAPEAITTALQTRGSKDALAEVVALQTQVQELQQARARDGAEAAIGAAIAAGKPIPASRREDFIARHMADPKGTDAWLADMPSINAGGFAGRSPAPASTEAGIDAGEAQIIALMGIDPAKFKAAKGVSP